MDRLPLEITHQYAQRLDAVDLGNYCASSTELSTICRDSYFWKEKIKKIPRRELQDDWFLQLARLGEEKLFMALCNELELIDWPIDEWAIVLALVYFVDRDGTDSDDLVDRRYPSYRLERYLINKVFSDASERTEHRLDHYFSSFASIDGVPATIHRYVESMRDDAHQIKNGLMKRDSFRTFVFQPTSLQHHLRQYEIEIIATELDLANIALLSPSAVLMSLLEGSDNSYTVEGLFSTIDNYLLPQLLREKRFGIIACYIDDIEASTPKLEDIMQLGEYDFSIAIGNAPVLVSYPLIVALSYVDSGTMDRLLATLGFSLIELINADTISNQRATYYRDPVLYRRVVEATEFDSTVLRRGFTCMEVDEWLDLIDSIEFPITERGLTTERDDLIQTAILEAKLDGYTHFSKTLESIKTI